MSRALDSSRRDSGQRKVQEVVARFAETWRAADSWIESIDIAAFLPPADDPTRLEALYGMIVIDLDMRYSRQQSITLEYYLEKFPELGSAATVSPELIHEEFAARQRHKQSPALDEYGRRFPNQFPRFKKILEEDASPTVSMGNSAPSITLPREGEVSESAGNVEQFLKQKGYRLFERLGKGGSGEVRRAEAPGGVEVAIKIIRRNSGEHLMADREQEALELIKGLRHPFLLQTQAYWSLEDSLVIVMELADATLTKAKDLPRAELLRIFHEAAEAIDFLHDKNIQHRDIKPSNILLLKGHAKVADFGLARFQTTTDQVTQAAAGTQAYMAPELLKGKFSKHSDQFGLALSYAELRRGEKVYPDRGANIAAFMSDRLTGSPNLSKLESAEEKVVRKALSKSPEARYRSCVTFVTALEKALAPAPPQPAMRWWIWLLVLLPLAWLVLINRSPTPPVAAVDWLPKDVEKFDENTIVKTVGDKRYYNRIAKIKNGLRIPFRLIPREKATDPLTFYMMENKVSNELYQAAVEDPEFQRLRESWKTSHPWTVKDPDEWKKGGSSEGQDLGIAGARAKWPVFRVTVTEAHCFACWLGGNLPSAEEWKKASGELNGFKAPYRDDDDPDKPILDGQIAIAGKNKIGLPMAVGTATRDISPFECLDMSGNGEEWTRSLNVSAAVGLANPNRDLLVNIRGRAYFRDSPLRFDEDRRGGTRLFERALPHTSFRVALELASPP